MAFSINPNGYWLWLMPSNKSISKLTEIRNDIEIDNGTMNFPMHLTLCYLGGETIVPNNDLLKIDPQESINKYSWKMHFNTNKYFCSIYMRPKKSNAFNIDLKNTFGNLKLNDNPHISLAYTNLTSSSKYPLNNMDIDISFSHTKIAYVDESLEMWQCI